MEYAAFVFGIFGLFAYLEVSSLKKKIAELERSLTKMEGTTYHEDRKSLVRLIRKCIGKEVKLELKEDHMDAEVINYGNTRHGTNTILDADTEWMLVSIVTPKGTRTKLLRTESVERISLREADQ